MNAKVGFKEVQNYAQLHNIDFKTAAQKLGLSAKEAEALEQLGGDPGAPVDGFTKRPLKSVTLKSGRKVNVYKDANGQNTYEYVSADGTKLKEDYFLQVEGLKGKHFAINSKGQLVTVKNAEQNPKQEETGFFARAYNKVKKDVGGYVKNFTDAWNNSSGALETTGALIGATTKTAVDVVKNNANNAEKGIAELTGSESLGKVARYAAGGLGADAAELVEKLGDWSADQIRDIAKNYTGAERQLLEEVADFVDDINAADLALAFAGGIGAAKYLKLLPQILKLLTAGGVATASLASCSDISQEQHVALTITQDSSLEETLNAIRQGLEVTNTMLQKILEREISNGMTLDEIKNLAGGNTKLLVALIDAMSENNNLLTEIKNNVGNGFENVLSAIVDVKQSVQTLTDLVAQFPQYKDELNEIINGIKTGNTTMTQMKALIEELLKQANKNGDVQVNILNKLTEIENSNKSDGEKLAAMLKLLGEIKAGIDGIADGLKEHFKNDATVNSYLEKILAEAKKNNAKTDETNALLQKLYNLVEKLGKNGDAMGKQILEYIAAVGFEMNGNFSKLIDAVNANGNKLSDKLDEITNILKKLNQLVTDKTDKDQATGQAIINLLTKAINKGDTNSKAIIDAINKIQISGGSVDLSSIEKMLAELLKQSKANGDILSNIDAKTDVISTTTKSILAALEKEFGKNDERYKNINNILNVIANKDSGKGDDTKLLAKLDEILAKLDEIKDAIKDHKVQVDVTGKVTCECNCGNDNKHEGILGDLNDILN